MTLNIKLVIPKTAIASNVEDSTGEEIIHSDGGDDFTLKLEDHSMIPPPKTFSVGVASFKFSMMTNSILAKLSQEFEEFLETSQAHNNVERRRALINLTLRHKEDLLALANVVNLVKWIPEWRIAYDSTQKLLGLEKSAQSAREAAHLAVRLAATQSVACLKTNILHLVNGIAPTISEPLRRLSLQSINKEPCDLFLMAHFRNFIGLGVDFRIEEGMVCVPMTYGIIIKFKLVPLGSQLGWWPESVDAPMLDSGAKWVILDMVRTLCIPQRPYDLGRAQSLLNGFLSRILLSLVTEEVSSLLDKTLINKFAMVEIRNQDLYLKTWPRIACLSDYGWQPKTDLSHLTTSNDIKQLSQDIAVQILQRFLAILKAELLQIIYTFIVSHYAKLSLPDHHHNITSLEKHEQSLFLWFLKWKASIRIMDDLHILLESGSSKKVFSINQARKTLETNFLRALDEMMVDNAKDYLAAYLSERVKLIKTEFRPKKQHQQRYGLAFCFAIRDIWGTFLLMSNVSVEGQFVWQLELITLEYVGNELTEQYVSLGNLLPEPSESTSVYNEKLNELYVCLTVQALSIRGYLVKKLPNDYRVELVNAPLIYPIIGCFLHPKIDRAFLGLFEVTIIYKDNHKQDLIINNLVELNGLFSRLNEEILSKHELLDIIISQTASIIETC